MNFKKGITLAAAVISGTVLSACTNIAVFDYNSAPGAMVRFPAVENAPPVTVLPFLDQRGLAKDIGDSGSFYLGLIPLVPWGYVEKTEPENSEDFVSLGRFKFDPANDLADAAEKSLKQSHLFKEVLRAPAANRARTDLVFQGTVTDTFYRGRMFSYGITYFLSPALWILGAPDGVSTNTLGVHFALIDRNSGKTLWTYQFHGSDYLVHWFLYARTGEDATLYARLMRQAMNGALVSLQKELSENR